MYRAKRYDDAVALFNFFFNQSNIVPNVVSYNFLIVSQCESGRVDDGFEVYRHILANAPFSPSSVTYRHLTKGLIDAGRIGEAVDLLREMLSKGHGADSLVFNNLIKGFLDLGDLGKANELFDELKERCLVYDGVVSATFMDWFFEQGREKEAMEAYKGLLDRQFRMIPATGNVLLECLLKHGREKDAWELFHTMLDNHTPPNTQAVNSDTFNIMVNECFRLGKSDEAVAAFRKVGVKANSKPFSMDVAGYNNIIVRFAEHGMIEEAEKFFEELRSKSLSPDVTGYRTLIDAFLKEKRVDDSLQMFHLMVDANLRVIPSYANKWLGELIENDKVIESSQLLTKLGEKDPKPDVMTYEIVIKGLCKAEAFDQCKDIICQMMRYGVGVTPTLKEFIVDVFEKEGQKDEIEKLLDRRTHNFGSRWQPNGNSGSPKPFGFPSNASPRIQQSAISSGSATSVGNSWQTRPNQSGAHAGSVELQRQAGGYGQGENGAFGRSNYEYTGASSALAGHGGYTHTRSQYQAAAQLENPRYLATNGGQVGYSGSGHSENARNHGVYEPSGFSAQSGLTGSHGPVGYGGQMGYNGPTNQFADQTGSSGPSGNMENARNQGAYEPPAFSAQTGSTRFPEPVQRGGQAGYTGSADQFAHQSGQWSSHPGHLTDTRYSQHQSGQSGFSVQSGQFFVQGEQAGYSQEVGLGHGQTGYTGSFDTRNR